MSTERPILFNGAMVRAILSGSKTQTRRVVKPQPSASIVRKACMTEGYPPLRGCYWEYGGPIVYCPFGQPGDRLWVRETWKTHSTFENLSPREVPPQSNIFYAADGRYSPSAARWRPSIHMPRWACRLVLEIIAVRVERLQALSNSDWDAEGISFCMEDPSTAAGRAFNEAEHYAIAGVSMRGTPEDHGMRAQFAEQGLDWDSNPWVWVIEFKQVAA